MNIIKIYINNLDDKRENFHFCESAEIWGDIDKVIHDFLMAYYRVHYDFDKIKYFKNGNINLYLREF